MAKKIGEIRNSQLISTFGIGSIFDAKEYSVMILGQEHWERKLMTEIKEERLESILRVNYFLQPDPDKSSKSAVIPNIRFPEWVFCPKCKTLGHYRNTFGSETYCMKCSRGKSTKQLLIPSRFIVACPEGHIDDFPWVWWSHYGKPCATPDMKINTSGKSVSLSAIWVNCSCGAKRSLAGIFNFGSLNGFGCTGRRPWLGEKYTVSCHSLPRTLQRSSSSVYYPNVTSALSIPPFSSKIHRFVSKLKPTLDVLPQNETIINAVISSNITQTGLAVSTDVIMDLYKSQKEMLNRTREEKDIKQEEYLALKYPEESDVQSDFLASEEEISENYEKYFEKIILVHRLREVRALTGFSRISSGAKSSMLSHNPLKWLPATEVRGEGIFIAFNESTLLEWYNTNKKDLDSRIKQIDTNKNINTISPLISQIQISPKLLLIHTFSHLLIRQLTMECGYSSSALRERLYISESFGNIPSMNGVLIYTSTGDSEGSLGGLVRQGKKDRFSMILDGCLENAEWCSNDPLCRESSGQGTDSLNLAACHSCVHIPETSCEINNNLLDRVHVSGGMDLNRLGYFDY